MFKKPLKQEIIKLSKDTRGNFAMIGAVVAPLLLAAGGLALDISNQSAMKNRFQAASDSVSLTVASRLRNGDLTVDAAEDFAEDLLNAQVLGDESRFSELTLQPEISVSMVESEGGTTWTVQVGGNISQSTTPFSQLMGFDQLEANITSSASSSTEVTQGALSMAVIIDVSGSMGWELTSSTTTYLETALDISYSDVETYYSKLEDLIDDYSLTLDDVTWIVENYTYKECKNLNSSGKLDFVDGIGLSSSYKSKAKSICKSATWPENKGASKEDLLDNLELAYNSSTTVITSMTRLDALKIASTALFAQFEEADQDSNYVRTGVVSYHSYLDDTSDMAWGVDAADEFVQDADDGGGTASTDAFKWAYQQLISTNSTEPDAHKAKNGQTDPDRFILFMTDGDNNNSSDDTSTAAYCEEAKEDGIIIYSVAFDAPEGGDAEELLSDCATSDDHYYEPDTAEELVAAFENIGAKSNDVLTRLTN